MQIKFLLSFTFFVFFFLSVCAASAEQDDAKIAQGPNVVFIIVDTVHAKHMGAYTSGLKNSPNIDKLAKTGVFFEKAYAVSSWTKPSVASLISGVMPSEHRVTGVRDSLVPDFKTVGEFFKEAGYITAGYASHIYLNESSGFSQGIDEYEQINQSKGLHTAVTSHLITDKAINWLNKKDFNKSKKNFFLFLHYFDPHFRYMPHAEFNYTGAYKGNLQPSMSIKALFKTLPKFTTADVQYLVDLYRGEIAYTDFQIGRLIDFLTKSGLLNNTLLVLTSDHGEEFLEHGALSHTRTLYDEILHIPLMIHFPNRLKAARISTPVTQLDILPTLLDLALNKTNPINGGAISLVPLMSNPSISVPERDLFSEVSYSSSQNSKKIAPDLISVRSGKYKLIRNMIGKSWKLYNLEADPREKKNLAYKQKEVLDTLAPKLRSLADLHKQERIAKENELPSSEKTPELFNKEEIKSLKSLGYL